MAGGLPPFVARPAHRLRIPERYALFAAGVPRFNARPTLHEHERSDPRRLLRTPLFSRRGGSPFAFPDLLRHGKMSHACWHRELADVWVVNWR